MKGLNRSYRVVQLWVLFYLLALGVFPAYGHSGNKSNTHKDHDMHMEKQVSVPEHFQTPGIGLSWERDTISGWNLHLLLENFEIGSPYQQWPEESKSLQGHGHLYINNKKIQRIYGKAVHIKQKWLSNGKNRIKVTFNTHHHALWMWKNKPLQAELWIDLQRDNVVLKSFSSAPLLTKDLPATNSKL
ncbi:hypothetical protein CI610_02309 [invertebrate metagenome]|uniref:Uncharacterized protein n=1 Tax=invertebrate metagenome TaxID=1711999 RepID=A0A2H9T6C7_9ZZZZ